MFLLTLAPFPPLQGTGCVERGSSPLRLPYEARREQKERSLLSADLLGGLLIGLCVMYLRAKCGTDQMSVWEKTPEAEGII